MLLNKTKHAKKSKTMTKKTKAKKQVKTCEQQKTVDHDSMIENGTSDESEYDKEELSDNAETSDDGFSEREESDEGAGRIQPPLVAIKRKAGVKPQATAAVVKKSKKNTDKVKPPTLEEINELKETRNLFHSNLFRLQVKEMLSELQIKEKYSKYIDNWLAGLKKFLQDLNDAAEFENMQEMSWTKHCELKIPLALDDMGIQLQQQKIFQFKFIKPAIEPFLIGAAACQALLGPKLVADVCILMPAACFQKDNYLNLVYEQKRAYYLTYLANKMSSSQHFEGQTMNFNYYANNPLKPLLELTPTSSIGKKLSIRLFVAAEEQSFKLSRFVPWNSNIRGSLFGDYDESNDSVLLATPNYNADVLFDLTMHRNQMLLNEIFEPNKKLQDGFLLLKIWLRQRQLDIGYSGFHPHILAMYVAYLYKQRKLHTNMSSYQVARTVWNNLAHSNWNEEEKGITLCTSENANNQPTITQFHAYYPVVFVDSTGFYNICSNLVPEMYERVRTEAKLAVNMLNDMKLNSFQLIFMTKYPIYTQFDHILKINKSDAIEQLLELHATPADKYNFTGYAFPQLYKIITKLLHKGLKQRINTLLPIEQNTESWPVTADAPICGRQLHLGLILNPEYAFEVLDKGPESIAPEAEEFRKFWGDKAQLRRFQDGSITESVVWAAAADTLAKKRLIVRSIVLHLLQQHFQLDENDVDYIAGEFDVLFKLTPAFKTDTLHAHHKDLPLSQDVDAEAVTPLVIRCFDDLARKLHALNELPLEIVTITGISSIFRYCEPQPILPTARIIGDKMMSQNVHHAIIQLGTSGKWPTELSALRALKTAFYIQIAKLLRLKHRLHCKVTFDGLLIVKQGYCFALELAHPKEVALLKEEKTDRGITQYIDCAASIELERRHYILPKVTGALHALYQLQPSFGPTVMIAKRWLYSQLIDDGLWPAECTELLVAALYLKMVTLQQLTCSPQNGFIRFLHLLAYTDWKSELFLLNFNNALNENEVSDFEQRYQTERDIFPPLCIATAYDQKQIGLLWTSFDKPNNHVLARVTILARQALAIIEPAMLATTEEGFIKPSRLFVASNNGYDLVIQVKPDNVPNTMCCEFSSPFAALGKPNWRLPLAGTNFLYDAVQKLRTAYSDYAAFFYNPCGGKEIAIVWKPASVFEPKPFKVTDVNGCTLNTEDPSKVQCQKETLIEDFKFILKDYYLRIDSVDAVLRASRETARYFTQNGIINEPKTRIKQMQVKVDKAKQKFHESNSRVAKLKKHIKVKINTNETQIENDIANEKVSKLKVKKLKNQSVNIQKPKKNNVKRNIKTKH